MRGDARAGVAWALVAAVPLAFLTLFFALPVTALVGRGLMIDGRLSPAGLGAALGAARTWRIVGQTLELAGLGTVVSLALGLPAAHLLYRTRFPGRRLVRACVSVPFVLPSVVVGVAIKSLLEPAGPLGRLGLDESLPAVVWGLVFFNLSVVVRTVGGLWARLDPRPAEAARTLGASPSRVWWTVTVPALAPAIASAAALVFLFCASAFGVVMVLGGVGIGTVETEIWYQTTRLLDLRVAAALSLVQLALVAACLAVANRLQGRADRAPRFRGDDSAERDWRAASDWATTLATGLTVILLLLLPMANLLVRSLHTPRGFGLGNFAALGGTGIGVPVSVWAATANSLGTALAATAIAVTLGLAVSLLVSRRPRRRGAARALAVLDSVFMLPLGVSAVTVGFGYLISLNRPPLDLRSSMALVPLAQAVVALPLVVRAVLPGLRAVDPRLREAAATLGAGPLRVLATVDLAESLRAIGVATGFALATSLGEFGATTFLARPDRPTLPVVIFHLIGRPGAENYGRALAASVLLAVLTGGAMAAAEALRPREASGW